MAEKLKERIRHTVLAFLLSAGLVMPLCGALDETLISPRLLLLIAGIILLFELASLHPATAWSAVILTAAGAAIWILAGEGARVFSNAGIAVTLRLKGIRTAIPLAARPVSILMTAGVTLLCCFAVLRSMTCIPALMLCIAVMMLVWLTDSMGLLPWLLPALAAVLTLLMTYRYDDTPALRVLPWAAGLVLIAFLLTGSRPPENPLKEKADEIRQAVMDRLFFTEARDIFSLYSVGFSPQGAEQLGGKPNPSENPVMQVSTPKTVYLRGTVYNRYTGHGWQNTTGGRRYLWQSRRLADTRAVLFDEMLPSESVQNSLSEAQSVSVRMLSGSASTLFVPQRVRNLNPGGEIVPYFSNSSEIFITRNLQEGDTWEVSAPLYNSTDPGIGTLTDICATLEDSRWDAVWNVYTELPPHLEKPVQDLAEEVTSPGNTPFEKAMALQNYLTRNFRYTLDVGEHPENVDFVTSFLLDTKKGYCTYFASAMTVLCRMAGLPARYVEGYLAEPNESGESLVTGLNAHAWTEVYFKGFGWLTFDATPGQHASGKQDGQSGEIPPTAPPADTPDSVPPEHENENTPEPTDRPEVLPPDDKTSAGPQDHTTGNEQEPPQNLPENSEKSFPWWLLILLAVSGIGLRGWMTSPAFREKRAKTEDKRFDLWADEITNLLRAEHLERRNGETPIAFAKRVDGTGQFSESVIPAGECLSLIRYSRATPLATDTELMRDTAMLLRGEISKGAKIRYLTHRLLSNMGIKRIIIRQGTESE